MKNNKKRDPPKNRHHDTLKNGDADWNTPCSNCGAKPTMYPTGLCGPCCTGEADTINGNW
jgi:hypothetical protein